MPQDTKPRKRKTTLNEISGSNLPTLNKLEAEHHTNTDLNPNAYNASAPEPNIKRRRVLNSESASTETMSHTPEKGQS